MQLAILAPADTALLLPNTCFKFVHTSHLVLLSIIVFESFLVFIYLPFGFSHIGILGLYEIILCNPAVWCLLSHAVSYIAFQIWFHFDV